MIQRPHIGATDGENGPFTTRSQQLLANIGLQPGSQTATTIVGEQINQLHIAGLGFIGKTAKFQLAHQLLTRPDMEVVPLRLPQPFADPLPIAVDKILGHPPFCCEIGEKREGMLAVTIPERKGAFLDFCRNLGPRMVTEFNYRYSDAELASLFVSVRFSGGDEELARIQHQLEESGYPVVNMTESELAKNHVRYMIGGRPARPLHERLYSFKFPEQPGALMRFLETLGCRWNISLFHYRNHGADYGRVLCAFELPDQDVAAFHEDLPEIGYGWKEVSDDPAYRLFLAS